MKKKIRQLLHLFKKKAAPTPIQSSEKIHHPFSALPLRPDEVRLVIDVGAFTGWYTVQAARSYPNATIVSFEPTDESAKQFLINTTIYSSRIQFHPIGLSDNAGEAIINLTTTGGANSVHPQSHEHRRQNPHVVECGKQKIILRTLDDVLQKTSGVIDVLKIDVEGFELNVLRGAKASLARTKFVILEVALSRDHNVKNQNVFGIFEFLQQANFHLYSIIDIYRFDEPHPILGMAQFDAIFCHNDL